MGAASFPPTGRRTGASAWRRYLPVLLTVGLGLAGSLISFSAVHEWDAWLILAGGLLLTGLVSAFFAVSIRRAVQIEHLAGELSKATDHLQNVIDSIADPFLVIDRNRRIVLANKAVRDNAGGVDPVACGLTCHQVSHRRDTPCDSKDDPCPLAQVLATKSPVRVVHTHHNAAGEARIVEVVASPVFNEAGEITHVIEAGRDITKRHRAEEERRRLAAILEATPDFVGFADAKDAHILYINKSGRLMTGLALDEDVTRLKISDVHPEWANRRLVETVLPTAARDGVWTGECAFLHRDGHEIPTLMVLLAHKTPSGEVEVFSTISRDITDRKRMEHELRRLAVIAEQAAEGIAVADLDGNLQFVNDAWARMHGYESGAELVGKSLRVFHTDEQLKTDVIPFNEGVNQRGHNAGEVGHVRRDGTTFPAQMMVTLLKDEQGKPYGLAGFAEDVTERKKAEEALRQANVRLGELAATDELTGLRNRRQFLAVIEKEVERARRYGADLALMMIDVDRFKSINDTCGHAFGDLVLREVAKLLVQEARESDVVARYAGDEFMVLMPHTGSAEAVSAAERIRKKMGQRQLSDGQRTAHVTVSAGIASVGPNVGTSPDRLIRAADEALYAAKHSGRDCTKTWDEVAGEPVPELQVDTEAVDILQRQVAVLSHQSQEIFIESMEGLVHALEARDPYTRSHSDNVMAYSVGIAETMGLPSDEVAVIRRAAIVHDIGKIGVPDAILRKPGDLTPTERRVVQQHVVKGVKIIEGMRSLERELPIVRHHHERWNGNGYPDGICGEAIPLGARILAAADAFDAITSNRVYRPKRDVPAALQIMIAEAGLQFDPVVVDALIGWVRRINHACGRGDAITTADLLAAPDAAAVAK